MLDFSWLLFLACMLLGSVVGLLAGLLGIGGGLIVVPALTFLLPLAGVSSDVAMPMALATSLASIVITSSSSAFSHHRLGNIEFSAAFALSPGLIAGGVFGSAIAHLVPTYLLAKIFAVIVFFLAVQMLLSMRFASNKTMPNKFITTFLGTGIGTISSLAGIGGGSFVVPFLNYHSIEIRKAIGTATICGIFLAVFGMLSFIFFGLKSTVALPQYSLGYVYLPALVGIVTTSVVTTSLGAKLVSRLPTKTIKRFFALFLFVIGISMLFKG